MKKSEYRNAVRSRRLICEALLALLDEKDLDRITVTDIAYRADINRGTFYLHYDSVGAVISELQDAYLSHMDQFFDNLEIPFTVDNTAIIVAECLRYIYQQNNGKYLSLIFHQQISFADKVCQNLQKRILESGDFPKDYTTQKQILVRAGILTHGVLGTFHSLSNGSLGISMDDLILGVDALVTDLTDLQMHKKRKDNRK